MTALLTGSPALTGETQLASFTHRTSLLQAPTMGGRELSGVLISRFLPCGVGVPRTRLLPQRALLGCVFCCAAFQAKHTSWRYVFTTFLWYLVSAVFIFNLSVFSLFLVFKIYFFENVVCECCTYIVFSPSPPPTLLESRLLLRFVDTYCPVVTVTHACSGPSIYNLLGWVTAACVSSGLTSWAWLIS